MTMKYLVLIVMTIMMLLSSCAKERTTVTPQQVPAVSVLNTAVPALRTTQRKGEDDDKKILMKIFSMSQQSISDATITVANETDTFIRHTDGYGQTLFDLPVSDYWDVTIDHLLYLPETSRITVVDSFTEKSYILKDK